MQNRYSNNNTKKIILALKGLSIGVIIFGAFCVAVLIWSILSVIFGLFIRGCHAGKRYKII
jgi:hypothetical protein